ncbi:scramblase [Spiractinospora alimapuensis]|uniref:phospholipid scramblase-related protein n=1 Tax=Spiractinospora alimapuensis TaxID=2820884 RepID=UPI001F24B361|nr:phospholipid scramblase-related protein [Spiractinospora alimapuensis]QVQ50290.1 scramblase [Spiractinospora alimapuensis]
MQDFFTTVPLVVRQPQGGFGTLSEYHCYDQWGRQVAHVREVGVDAAMQVFRVIGPLAGASHQRRVVVSDGWQRPRLYIHKEWSFGAASTVVQAPDGSIVGRIHQQLRLLQAEFHLKDAHQQHLGTIQGDLFAHDFQIFDAYQHEICRVNRRLQGLAEVFTTADTYVVWRRYLDLPEPLLTLVVASAIVIDLVLHEG